MIENTHKQMIKYAEDLAKMVKDLKEENALLVKAKRELEESYTERIKLQDQLRQAQKMEAIGTLAGGIAHDFNNILSGIFGFTEIVMMDIPEGSVARSMLDEVLKAGIRAKDLVGQILTFSRKTEMEYMKVQIKMIVKEAMKLLRPSLPSTIEIRENFSTSREILADPTQIHQVVMNLCTNAYHAMSEDGGVLEIALLKENLDEESAAEFEDLIPGPYIKLTISDTGHGMDEEVMDQIFDPYFTTKEKGRGTGLGLSVVHGIVKSHGGAITVSSAPGKGTTFHALFPILEKVEIKKEELATGPLPGGNERVLFVDDETPLVKIGKAMLGWLGYDVTVSTGSLEALELFKAKPEAFDLVISDMTMPKMTGDKLAMKIMEIRPEIPVILCTGYSEKINEGKSSEIGIAAYVPKPIIINEIAKTIREVLDKK